MSRGEMTLISMSPPEAWHKTYGMRHKVALSMIRCSIGVLFVYSTDHVLNLAVIYLSYLHTFTLTLL